VWSGFLLIKTPRFPGSFEGRQSGNGRTIILNGFKGRRRHSWVGGSPNDNNVVIIEIDIESGTGL
jgi:hypothetical protein